MNIICLIFGMFLGFALFISSSISLREKEFTAFRRLLFLSIISFSIFLFFYFLNSYYINLIVLLSVFSFILYFLLPEFKFKNKPIVQSPKSRIDERNIMFSRNRLNPGSENFKSYYTTNPEKKINDDTFRKNPGLLSPKSTLYSLFPSEAADANFYITEHLKAITETNNLKEKQKIIPKDITLFIKNWLKKIGAIDVGFGKIEEYHFYSHHGYNPKYGEPINPKHKYAISFLVEMDKDSITTAPNAPVVMESSQQYLTSATMAIAVTKFINNLGYSAQAHIDGKYDIVAPLVARDCGLGEIGRMGLLISKQLGPRVRIAIITTDIPLELTINNYDSSVDEFCKVCLKCANICPSQSIPLGEKTKINGIYRWQIDQEKCFNLWTKFGTDCGRCMQVCPYSHPNNLFHNIIRIGIKYFPNFRKFAAKMDDLVYGKNPKSSPTPIWMINSQN